MSRKTLLFALGVVLLGLGIASPAHAGTCTPLALTVTPNTAEEFTPVAITNSVTNCSPSLKVVTINVNFTADTNSCGDHSEAFAFKVLLRPSKTRSLSFSIPAPACEGTYTVKETSSNGGNVTASLTVN